MTTGVLPWVDRAGVLRNHHTVDTPLVGHGQGVALGLGDAGRIRDQVVTLRGVLWCDGAALECRRHVSDGDAFGTETHAALDGVDGVAVRTDGVANVAETTGCAVLEHVVRRTRDVEPDRTVLHLPLAVQRVETEVEVVRIVDLEVEGEIVNPARVLWDDLQRHELWSGVLHRHVVGCW